ncbi:acyl-CoA dehydrogenase family protein [Candidatus Uabimicrobium sp. HlEnr_7]|uniref:acyl-CoA dehydrogenase family protein n=1 Tax=Candidatus Uabimicrobium helgolandensis TaxID=3095367 RepID=UPI0035590515
MNFEWTEEQQQSYRNAVLFAQKKLNKKIKNDPENFMRCWKLCAEYGIQSLLLPESEIDSLTVVTILEALSYGCEDTGFLFSICAHMFACMKPILLHGSEQQQKKYIPMLVNGSSICANCMTEPGAGSDAFSLSTIAIQEGDYYVLNGSKSYSSNAPIADLFVLYATTNKKKGILGITAFIVDKNDSNVSCSKPYKKMGLESSFMGDVFLDDCKVPVANRIGREGKGAQIFTESMEWERSCLFAIYLGSMQRQLEECISYSKNRKQFGESISKFDSVAHKIADMKIRLEASRLLLYKAVSRLGSEGALLDAAIAKLFVSEAAIQSSLDAIQIHGAYGIMDESGITQYLKDSIPAKIFSGTSEIQRKIIAQELKL